MSIENQVSIAKAEAPGRLLSVKETAHLLGIARRTLEREVDRRKFPRPLKIGSKSLYFRKDVETYLARLEAQRALAP
jgi:excisionase family DNA binding protein